MDNPDELSQLRASLGIVGSSVSDETLKEIGGKLREISTQQSPAFGHVAELLGDLIGNSNDFMSDNSDIDSVLDDLRKNLAGEDTEG